MLLEIAPFDRLHTQHKHETASCTGDQDSFKTPSDVSTLYPQKRQSQRILAEF